MVTLFAPNCAKIRFLWGNPCLLLVARTTQCLKD